MYVRACVRTRVFACIRACVRVNRDRGEKGGRGCMGACTCVHVCVRVNRDRGEKGKREQGESFRF